MPSSLSTRRRLERSNGDTRGKRRSFVYKFALSNARLPVIRHLSREQTSRIRESVSRGLDWCGGDDTQIPESKHTYVRPRDIGRAEVERRGRRGREEK